MHRCVPPPPARAIPRPMSAAFALVLLAAPLSACNDRAVNPVERAAFVHTEIVQPQDGHASLTLTGEVQARFQRRSLVSGQWARDRAAGGRRCPCQRR